MDTAFAKLSRTSQRAATVKGRGVQDRPDAARAAEAAELEKVRRRAMPGLYVIDDRLRVVLASPSLDSEAVAQHLDAPRSAMHLPPQIESTVRRLLAANDVHRTHLIAIIPPLLVVRVTPLVGDAGNHIAVFIERFESRDMLRGARERYMLSPREIHVVELLVVGNSTAEIASTLCIAETTVQDHVKNLARKTGARNRAEIVARVLSGE